jgi:hypothetical protein
MALYSLCIVIGIVNFTEPLVQFATEASRRNNVNWILLTTGTTEESNIIRQRIRNIKTFDGTTNYTIEFDKSNRFVVINNMDELKSLEQKTNERKLQSNFDFREFRRAIVFVLTHAEINDLFFRRSNYYERVFERLQIISLANTNITDAVVPEIVAMISDCKDSLRIIDVKNTQITDAGLNILREKFPNATVNPELNSAPVFFLEAALEGTRLDFSDMCIVTDNIIKQFEFLPITHIILRGMPVTNEILLSLHTMNNLIEIDLQNTLIEGEQYMEFLSDLPSLCKLNIRETNITSAGISRLQTSQSLLYLQIGCTQLYDTKNTDNKLPIKEKNSVEDGGFALFPSIHPLRILELCSDSITDKTLHELSRLKNLQSLTISRTKKITDTGLLYLNNAESLIQINLLNTSITKDGLKNFHKLRPKVVMQLQLPE